MILVYSEFCLNFNIFIIIILIIIIGVNEQCAFNIGSSEISGGYFGNNGGNNYYPGLSHQANQPNYGSYGGSQSSANANANANANTNANTNAIAKGNGGVYPVGSSYYPSQTIGNANANANANAGVLASGGTNVIPDKYSGGEIDKIEVIPVNTLPLSRPIPSVVHSIPHQPPKSDKEDVIIIVEESPQFPPYHRPGVPHHHQHHRQPNYGSKLKQQPIEIVIIEEPIRSNSGDIS